MTNIANLTHSQAGHSSCEVFKSWFISESDACLSRGLPVPLRSGTEGAHLPATCRSPAWSCIRRVSRQPRMEIKTLRLRTRWIQHLVLKQSERSVYTQSLKRDLRREISNGSEQPLFPCARRSAEGSCVKSSFCSQRGALAGARMKTWCSPRVNPPPPARCWPA